MEDILASIRRIIAEDQSNNLGRSGLGGLTRRAVPSVSAPAPSSMPESLADAPVAQLSEEPAAHAAPQGDVLQHAYVAPVEDAHEPAIESPAPEVLADLPQPEEPSFETYGDAPVEAAGELPAVAPDDAEPLMSPLAGASITSSFQTLAESVVLQDPGLIERVMREAMRPLLKAWLDDHLPSIVERLVRVEIERVARGGRARNT